MSGLSFFNKLDFPCFLLQRALFLIKSRGNRIVVARNDTHGTTFDNIRLLVREKNDIYVTMTDKMHASKEGSS